MKILTGVAAIQALGADRTFTTSVRVGATPEEIVIVGGGDPYLMRRAEKDAYPRQADLASLAARTASALEEAGVTTVRLGFDDSLFTGPRVSPDWPVDYITDSVVSPITALFVDQGHREDGPGFEQDPARAAAEAFVEELGRRGITVEGKPERTVAPDEVPADDADVTVGAEDPADSGQVSGGPSIDPTADPAEVLVPGLKLAAVHSAPVWQVVSRVLAVSDNEGAELLAHHVALELGAEPTFEGAAIAVEAALDRLGVDLSDDLILDASGLARGNRLSAATLLDVLSVAASPEHPQLRPAITGLPIAGFTGSLAGRYVQTNDAAAGRVRAKTGTLTGVHALAGVTTDLDGNVFTFAFLADKVKVPDTLDARAALEKLTAALAACECSS
jgi:D-alanyl-D-alanine carboxypeptidase/D-alanyl-D-alanine-endopeptidase (penicillin-binding protein 4)